MLIGKEQMLKAVDEAPELMQGSFGYCDSATGPVCALGAIVRAIPALQPQHIYNNSCPSFEFFADLAAEFDLAFRAGGAELARLYALFIIEAFCPAQVEVILD